MPMSNKIALACLSLLTLASACETLGPPSALPPNAMLISAPPDYTGWWSKTEACSEITGDLGRIEWFVVPQAETFETQDGEKVGLWSRSSAGVRIVVAGNYIGNELVVRHEMLHALLNREGHPPEYFQTRCHLTWETWNQGNSTPALAGLRQ